MHDAWMTAVDRAPLCFQLIISKVAQSTALRAMNHSCCTTTWHLHRLGSGTACAFNIETDICADICADMSDVLRRSITCCGCVPRPACTHGLLVSEMGAKRSQPSCSMRFSRSSSLGTAYGSTTRSNI
jgi:hypothetical protein